MIKEMIFSRSFIQTSAAGRKSILFGIPFFKSIAIYRLILLGGILKLEE